MIVFVCICCLKGELQFFVHLGVYGGGHNCFQLIKLEVEGGGHF